MRSTQNTASKMRVFKCTHVKSGHVAGGNQISSAVTVICAGELIIYTYNQDKYGVIWLMLEAFICTLMAYPPLTSCK